jgi:hypothetical protein
MCFAFFFFVAEFFFMDILFYHIFLSSVNLKKNRGTLMRDQLMSGGSPSITRAKKKY